MNVLNRDTKMQASASTPGQRVPEQPLVSIVTPTFNSISYLSETLSCIEHQSYPRIEHIVVDGGSTDGTLELLEKYPRIRWISEADRGMYDAINKGLRLAQGSILAYLNSDDLYFPDTVNRVVGFLGIHPETDLVFSDCRFIDESGNTLFTRKFPPYRYVLFGILDGSTVAQQTCFWRKRVHDVVGYFDADLKMAADFEFIIRVGERCSIRKIRGSPLAQFRFHPEMQTLNRKQINDAEIRLIHDRHPIVAPWVRGPLRVIAKMRYKASNFHRVKDKSVQLLSGRRPKYRP